MALRQYEDDCLRLQTEEKTKNEIERLAKDKNYLICYTNTEPENDYNIPLNNEDWDIVMKEINNPKYNEKLGKSLKRRITFEE